MFNKTIENLTFEDIRWLIENAIVEDQGLEYKKEVWGNSDANKKEMLKDIVAMANRYGGYIIIGIEEEGEAGQASRINNIPNAEEERDKILSSLFANTQPRLQAIKIKVLTDNEVSVLVISVPNSFRKPHIITFQGLNQFWIRHDRQKMPMSVDEIQDAVINTVNLTKDISSFFSDRKKEVVEEIGSDPTIIMGIYPMTAEKEMVNISDTILREYLKTSPRIREHGANFEFNYVFPTPSYNGLLIGGDQDYRTVELFRNGYLEGRVDLSPTLRTLDNQGYGPDSLELEAQIFSNYSLVEFLYSLTKQAKQIYSYLGYDGQIIVSYSLFNIKDLGLQKYRPGVGSFFGDLVRWRKDNLELPPIVFTEIDDVIIAKTIGDRVWQSFGFENEPFFEGRDFRV